MTEVANQGLRTRAVLRSVLLVVAVAAVLYVAYLLRRPL